MMLSAPAGYRIDSLIYESNRSVIYRGVRLDNNQPVVFKTLQPKRVSRESLGRLQREFELTRELEGEGVIHALDMVDSSPSPFIILEDYGGISLADYLEEDVPPLADFLEMSVQIVQALGNIHQQNVIHKDINPANILWNKSLKSIKIIDFGLATTLNRETPEVRNPHVLEGTLAYISPEQTGRMNRAMDYRSDFYSLGVTFYQLLTGERPFDEQDAMALVHAHIAREPMPPHLIRSAVPEVLSHIVLKLMAKNAEDRYQSAFGLLHDLQQCLNLYTEYEEIPLFPLAEKDVSSRFQLPQTQLGHHKERKQLLTIFHEVANPQNGRFQTVLIDGQPGMGKSALVYDLSQSIITNNGIFAHGKCDPLNQTPYASILEAMNNFIHQILMEDEQTINYWRTSLQQALSSNAQIVIDVLPSLALILGDQANPASLPAIEAEARFFSTFQQLFMAIMRPEHPLVLFLDDWHWMDSGSCELLDHLCLQQSPSHLLLLGTVREEELPTNQEASQLVKALNKSDTPFTWMELEPVSLDEVNQYIAKALHREPASTLALAELVQQKTGGNPFFLSEFLTSLYQNGLIQFNFDEGTWVWDLDQIQQQEITDNVVDLMIQRIQLMDIQSQKTLMLAACLGSQFDLQMLSMAYGETTQQTAVDLYPAVQNQFLIPLSNDYQLAELDALPNAEYKFAHSRIQQAAYSLIPTDERASIHRQFGLHLLQNLSEEEQETHLFTIVKHLNLAQDLLVTQDDRYQLIMLNKRAAQKASAANAYGLAYTYCQIALSLMAPTLNRYWQNLYPFTLDLFQTAVQAAFYTGNHDTMHQYMDAVYSHANTLLEKIPTYSYQLIYYTAQNRINEAVDLAITLLKQLGISLPRYPKRQHIVFEMVKTQLILRRTSIDKLLQMPPLSDPQKIAAADILYSVGSAAYFSLPELFGLMVLKLIQINATSGIHSQGPPSFAAFGLMLTGYLKDIENGFAYGKLGLELAKREENRYAFPQTAQLYTHYLHFWKMPYRGKLEVLDQAHRIAVETGNLEMIAYTAYTATNRDYFSGSKLSDIKQNMLNNLALMVQTKQQKLFPIQSIYTQITANLLGNPTEPWVIDGEYAREQDAYEEILDSKDQASLCTYYVQKAALLFLFSHYSEANEYCSKVDPLMTSVAATYLEPFFALLHTICKFAVWPDLSTQEQKQAVQLAQKNLQNLNKWVQGCPENFRNKQMLVAAELARIQGDHEKARPFYDESIAAARTGGFVQEEAMAYELAAKFYLEIGHDLFAQYYLQGALEVYERWEAQSKVNQLTAVYPQLQPSATTSTTTTQMVPVLDHTVSLLSGTTTGLSSTTSGQADSLDLTSIFKVSQALSREIVLESLLMRLMDLVIENAGAQDGYLLLREEERWQIAAVGGTNVQANTKLPQSILNYVARTKETVVLENAAERGAYVQDPVISHRKPKSVLCLPLLHNDNLAGLLYLENNLSTAVFTTDRLITLNLIASQAAISLENAQLYHQLEMYGRTLEDQVAERTAELVAVNQSAQKARAAAEIANENKNLFLSNMSHELRTPLNSIMGFTRIVLRQGKDTLPDKQVDNLNKVLISAEHLLSLINTVLDIARIEAGHMDLYLSEFDPIELLHICLGTTRTLIQKGVSLQTEFPEDALTVYSDMAKIKQIIINLMSNAAKFTHAGEIVVSLVPHETTMDVVVRDTGIGIAEESLPRIFEEFQQAESTTRQQYGGTGLGLPISRSLARLLGGDLTASSTLGKGSTFVLSIPIRYEAPETAVMQEVVSG